MKEGRTSAFLSWSHLPLGLQTQGTKAESHCKPREASSLENGPEAAFWDRQTWAVCIADMVATVMTSPCAHSHSPTCMLLYKVKGSFYKNLVKDPETVLESK